MDRARGKYQLIARVGQGGMADVFLAMAHGALGFDKLVILKRLRPMLAADIAFRDMFVDEARLAGLLNHPNIVQTLEVGEHDGAFIIAMEYLEGQPLDVFVKEAKRAALTLSPTLCAQIASDVLAGLHHAHEQQDYAGRALEIVHRDVSPQNVFLTYDGHVKLLDFGVAKAKSRVTETDVGTVKGKTGYMPPEQFEGGDVDRRADIFAVGVVLWELLTLERLFPAAQRGPVPPLPETFPPELAAIVEHATRPARTARYKTAAEMRNELEAFAAGVERRPRRDELAHLVSTLFHGAREQRREQVRKHMTGLSPESAEADWDRVLVLGSDDPTAVDRPRSQRSGATAGGALASDVNHEGRTMPRVPPSTPPTAGASGARAAWPILLGALVVGGLAAALVVPWWQARHDVPAPSAPAPSTSAASDVLLRLCGSYSIATELAPGLVDGFLHRKEVDKTERRRVGSEWRWTVTGTAAGRPAPLTVDIGGEGSGSAFDGLASGGCDVGMASRRINADEIGRLRDAGVGDMTSPASEHVLGLEGIAVIVHPNSPVRELTLRQVRDLFTGVAPDWSSVGATGGPVRLYSREDDSATWETFKQLVLGGAGLAGGSKRFPINDSLADAVASDPAAIGFVGFNHVRGAKAVAISEPDAEPIYPSRFTVGTEEYPLVRRLYLYTSDHPTNPSARDFVSFALSAEGQAVVKASGFTDLAIWMRDAEDACRRGCPPRYADLVKHARRLSLAFRFRSADVALDSRALRDLDRLVAFLGTLSRAKVLVIGLSDRDEGAKDELALSRERAKKVADELTRRGVHPAVTEGFGSALKVSSGTDDAGRERNRRVEVWVELGDGP